MRPKVIMILIPLVFLLGCAHQKVFYELPAEMSPTVKEAYAKQCEKGKALYDIHCAQCHNTKVKGKVIIPDFTPEQLIGYELRMSNPKHVDNMNEEKLSAEDLGLIMTFFNYKKKNSPPAK